MSDEINPDIVVFTNGNLFSRIILDKFLRKYQHRISMVVLVSGDYYGNGGLKALFEFSKTTSLIYVFYKIWTIILIKLLKIGNRTVISSVDQLCDSLNIPNYSVVNINEKDVFKKVEKLSPQYLVSVSCPQLIRQKWLDMVGGRGINIHSSLLPKYGGLAPYFWVLVNNEHETGITVHYLIKGFDKGNILSQFKMIIGKKISSFTLFTNLCIEGQNNLMDGFSKMERGDQGMQQDLKSFTYYSHPTSSAYFKLKKNGFSLFNLSDFLMIKSYIKNLNFKIKQIEK